MKGGRSDEGSAARRQLAGDAKTAERERLAIALRDNLKRRKAQGRARRIESADQGVSASEPE